MYEHCEMSQSRDTQYRIECTAVNDDRYTSVFFWDFTCATILFYLYVGADACHFVKFNPLHIPTVCERERAVRESLPLQ